MALISLQDVSLAFGGPLLFDQMNLQLESGERVALLGRNGVGKTTLMKVMAGQVSLDQGKIVYQKDINVTHLPQEVPKGLTGTVFDIVFSGLGERAQLIKDYHHVAHLLQTDHAPKLMQELDRLQEELNHTDGWDLDAEAENVLSHMKLNGDDEFESLSGGQKRRVLLAKALVLSPEVLLLDEPTNHLDIESIEWLEGFLKAYHGTILFVTHDRMFMRHMATKIVELDRGKLFSWSCDYDIFLERKQAALEVEANQRVEFAKKLSQEEAWIRKGIKARRTRNEGRVKALERMRAEKRAQRQVIGQVRMVAQESNRSGQIVIKAKHLGFSYGDQCLIRDFSTNIVRGDKIGLMGSNGSGKTTLINLMLGKLALQAGELKMGTNVKVTYFDQLREQLDESKTVMENVSDGSDTVVVDGKPRHVIGYLQDFLFSPEQCRTPVKVLSGGERNRLLLARLFTRASNLLVMDEPTNDLDVETLELLEELLLEYKGTLLLVSHDRAFLNNVVTSTIVLDGDGEVGEYVGGYDDWLNIKQKETEDNKESKKSTVKKTENKSSDKPRQLSSKEKHELEDFPLVIEKLEGRQDEILESMAEPDFFNKDSKEIARVKVELESVEEELLNIYQRWEYLEDLSDSFKKTRRENG
ncbi:MAG: ATP-binding cassette domain-containing protein [Candidatus Zapsychrus exili]|nr:ATP-binding cassette domain-containing protein [Candidatus Zapsychrus exili]